MTISFHLIGLPTDHNSSFERGAALAPPVIREALWSDRGNMACENGLEIGVEIIIIDQTTVSIAENTRPRNSSFTCRSAWALFRMLEMAEPARESAMNRSASQKEVICEKAT